MAAVRRAAAVASGEYVDEEGATPELAIAMEAPGVQQPAVGSLMDDVVDLPPTGDSTGDLLGDLLGDSGPPARVAAPAGEYSLRMQLQILVTLLWFTVCNRATFE
jgi:hypothetical protein